MCERCIMCVEVIIRKPPCGVQVNEIKSVYFRKICVKKHNNIVHRSFSCTWIIDAHRSKDEPMLNNNFFVFVQAGSYYIGSEVDANDRALHYVLGGFVSNSLESARSTTAGGPIFACYT